MSMITMREAISQALWEEMERDEKVFILGEEVGVSLYVFGYRDDTAFAAMPKIRVRFGALKHAIYDQNRSLPLSAVRVDRKPKEIMIRVPLALLGNPQKILTSARTYSGAVPLDWVSWRTLEIAGPQTMVDSPRTDEPRK